MRAKHSSPAKLVMVEDNSADVFLLRHALDQHSEDYVLDVLRDGEEAIEFVQRQRSAPDDAEPCVIVLDLHLPKHDGTAVLKLIKQEPALASVKVVALTTLASPRDEQEVRELGVRLYRAKPTLVEEWIKLAGEILDVCREHARVVMA
ncbi:MAG TPA: response regulator [Bryobacteraceae bacterium]|nr:response regulator [Bryobacteraceae bacterium]